MLIIRAAKDDEIVFGSEDDHAVNEVTALRRVTTKRRWSKKKKENTALRRATTKGRRSKTLQNTAGDIWHRITKHEQT